MLASPAYEPLQTKFLLASIQTNSRTMRKKKLCIPFPDCVQTVHQRNAVLVTFWEPLLVEVGSTFGRPSGCSKNFVLDGSQNSTSQKWQKFILWILSGSHCPRLSPDSLQNGHSQIRTSGFSHLRTISIDFPFGNFEHNRLKTRSFDNGFIYTITSYPPSECHYPCSLRATL